MGEDPSYRDVANTSVVCTGAPINFRALVDENFDCVIAMHL